MDTLDALRDLDVPTVTTLVVVAGTAALVALDPVLGRRQYARLVDDLAAADDDRAQDAVRRRFYRTWIRQGWLTAAVVVAAVLLLPGIGLAELGLRLPDLSLLAPGADRDDATGMAVGAVVGIALAAGALALARRRLPAVSQPPRSAAADALWPATPAARRGWAGLSLSAGVTEEISYRGLLVLALLLAVPDLPHGAVVALAALLFGVAHWYQGRLGMLATGVLGALLTQLYLSTGSLLLPMVLHVLIDLRPVLHRPAKAAVLAPADAR
ncbi:CPBP family intramembrane glutamic endopeptidase [Cellulomonas sp. P5_C5]